ncbi:FtsW/RodA/SpoVE family cell cycle protein [Paenibacillus pini]|uniref:Cell division protein FtsW n=1 Tax=Paenibacillus pini JCM 16418 TaxID=1236976 RepID=W7YZT1_9BACL|nr:FtsW/RodA/SpoVE family cell cycle protein [Paenibacillus pini]GAF10186.1 cell division protein FtsW [Paenibacillus pini JCM 16418]
MRNKLKCIDWTIVLILLALMVISVLSIHSVTFDKVDMAGFSRKTIYNYIIGFAAFLMFSLINYKLLIKYAWIIYAFGIILLLFALLAGKEYYGAKGWISVAGISLQPAELFKLFLVLFIARLLYNKENRKLRFWKDIVPIVFMTLIPWLIVMKQNDLGNALSYLTILAGLLWIGNIKYSHALIALAIVVTAVFAGIQSYITYHDQAMALFKSIGKDHWIARFDPWIVPDLATGDASYQTKNAKIAIGTGGIEGKGYMKGTMVQGGRIPLAFADSIFVQIAEEYGFVGSSILMLLYFILIHRMVLIAIDCRDRAGPLIIAGVITMFIYQIFVNIGAFIGLMPLTGITLPFISYGGTSVLINMISVGIVMSIRIHGQEVEDELSQLKPRELWYETIIGRIGSSIRSKIRHN